MAARRNAAAGRAAGGRGVQAVLDEDSFERYLDGFETVEPADLLEARGGRVRYAIDAPDGSTQYRLGGWLLKVDPALRYLRLFNPYARRSWSVQLTPDTRLWYMPPGTSDEVAAMRRLLQQLETGAVRVTKVR